MKGIIRAPLRVANTTRTLTSASVASRHHCYFVIVIVMLDLVAGVFDGSEMARLSCRFLLFFFTCPGAAQGRLAPPFFHLKLSTSMVQKPKFGPLVYNVSI